MEESKRTYTVDVWIDEATYRAFSVFDAIRKDRKWIRPAGFALIFICFAVCCFVMKRQADQATLLGAVLLIVGLGLPLTYFGSYYTTLQKRVEKLKLKKQKRHAYCVTLSETGLHAVTPKGEETDYPWGGFYMAYRVSGAIYLYVEATKAYILPKAEAGEAFDDIWMLICGCLPLEKRQER